MALPEISKHTVWCTNKGRVVAVCVDRLVAWTEGIIPVRVYNTTRTANRLLAVDVVIVVILYRQLNKEQSNNL